VNEANKGNPYMYGFATGEAGYDLYPSSSRAFRALPKHLLERAREIGYPLFSPNVISSDFGVRLRGLADGGISLGCRGCHARRIKRSGGRSCAGGGDAIGSYSADREEVFG